MESPHKKRKLTLRESQHRVASSTPKKSLLIQTESLSMSGIEMSSSSHDQVAENISQSSSNKENQNEIPKTTSFFDLLDSASSVTEFSVRSEAEEDLDYDEFFRTCNRINLKGFIWNLYKPISEEEGSLYHQITTNPRQAAELAKWFVHYCNSKPVYLGTYILYRFYFDCSGYQKFNLKKYFAFPPDIEGLLKKLNRDDLTNAIITSKKFLFGHEGKWHLAKIFKFAIYNFLQKFILEAHQAKMLEAPIFTAFFKLLTSMCEHASYIPLVYTAFVFVIKMLTAFCMVREKNADLKKDGGENAILDSYINVLYVCFSRVSRIVDQKGIHTLKISCINELKLWIQYSANVFVNYYNCIEVLKELLLDKVISVRLAALEASMTIIKNQKLVTHLKGGSILSLSNEVFGRTCDINVQVQIKAIEVAGAMVTYYLADIRRNLFEKLMDILYHKDHRIGFAAGKCLIEILAEDNTDEKTMLLYICKIAKKYHSNIKLLLVDSCIDHTNVLNNWHLILEVLLNTSDKNISLDLKSVLSELFLESVQISLTGKPSKLRASYIERSVNFANHGLIANEIYPNLKRIIALYKKDDIVIQNILKILVKIAPEYLTKEHCEVAEQLIEFFIKLFIAWNNKETLDAFLDYLVYVNQNLPQASSSPKNAIEDLKKYISEELYKSFKSKDNHTLIITMKTALVFKYFDLNEHIEWSKLLSAWTLIESNPEFIENTLASCHWSLMWRIKKLITSRQQADPYKKELNKEITLISKISSQFFSVCYEVVRLEDKNMKFKGFERICESCIAFYLGLENFCKQNTAAEVLKPNLEDDVVLRHTIMIIFELGIDPNVSEDVAHCHKYIVFIYNMACLNIFPVDFVSHILKYFDIYYEKYGNLIEMILIAIRQMNKHWIPLLIVNALALLYEGLLEKHGVVDVKTQEAKLILSLAKRFRECKKVMRPQIAAKLLLLAVNYVSVTKQYDFLIYVRVFTDDVQHLTEECEDIIQNIRKRIPEADRKHDSILYFMKHIRGSAAKTIVKSKTVPAKDKPGKLKGKRLFKKQSSQTTESESSENISIHDTTSDDLNFTDLSQ